MLSSRIRLLAGTALLATGTAATLAGLGGYAKGMVWQGRHRSDTMVSSSSINPVLPPVPGAPFARLRIPRIGMDLTVVEGTRPEDLLKAPGHLSGTGLPGERDNCVVAGHRDIHFRRLGELRKGDAIELSRGVRRVRYVVDEVRVVKASEEERFVAHGETRLTLVTCYPFRYVGPAPQRFVVLAGVRSISPEPPER